MTYCPLFSPSSCVKSTSTLCPPSNTVTCGARPLSAGFKSDARGKGRVRFGIHLGHLRLGVSEDHLGGLQPIRLADLRPTSVPELVRMPDAAAVMADVLKLREAKPGVNEGHLGR